MTEPREPKQHDLRAEGLHHALKRMQRNDPRGVSVSAR